MLAPVNTAVQNYTRVDRPCSWSVNTALEHECVPSFTVAAHWRIVTNDTERNRHIRGIEEATIIVIAALAPYGNCKAWANFCDCLGVSVYETVLRTLGDIILNALPPPFKYWDLSPDP